MHDNLGPKSWNKKNATWHPYNLVPSSMWTLLGTFKKPKFLRGNKKIATWRLKTPHESL